jgi:hypothetical protein
VQEVCKLTLVVMMWSAPAIVDGGNGDWRFSSEPEGKGTPKFILLLAPLVALLLQNDL